MKKILSALMTMILGTVLVAGNAMALPINGEIGFVGVFSPEGGTGGLDDATGLTFSSFLMVAEATGDLASASSQTVAFSNFDFDPALYPSPVNPLWQIPATGTTEYSFDLYTISVVTQLPDFLSLSGTGIMHATGFDDTPGVWNFTGNTLLETVFTFSSGSASIPDPLAVFLLGSACLIGFVTSRRKKRR